MPARVVQGYIFLYVDNTISHMCILHRSLAAGAVPALALVKFMQAAAMGRRWGCEGEKKESVHRILLGMQSQVLSCRER